MLQSSFFGGPRGKDFLVSKILSNAAEARDDLDLGASSAIRVDDYILISYGVLSYSETSDYQTNLGKDDNVNYNAKVYQKVIKNKSSSFSNNDIVDPSSEEGYAYKFIIDLSSELRINFTTDGDKGNDYNVTYDEGTKTYILKMPKPSISYENKKLKIVLNGETLETEVANSSINITNKFPLEFSGENFDSSFEAALNQKTDFSPAAENWYLIDCKFTDTSSTSSYWTVFAYAHQTKTVNISNSECIYYSKVSGNASSSSSEELPEYIKKTGIFINGENNQKTVIDTDTGLITTGAKAILPGQLVYYDIKPEDTNLYIPAGNNLYYEPSPLEEKLYNEIEEIKTLQQQQPQEVVLKNTAIIGKRAISWFPDGSPSGWAYSDISNFYSRTSSTSNTYDVFSNNNTSNYINEKYLAAYAGTSNLYDLTNGLKYSINDLKDYDKIILTFKYQPKNITTEFYMSLININNVSKNRLITLNLSNGFKEFNLVFKKRQDGNFYLSYSDLQDSWKTTFYYDTALTDDEYSSASSIDKLNPFFVQDSYIYLSLSTSSGATQRAYNSYYKNFTDYFNSLSVTLKGYKD